MGKTLSEKILAKAAGLESTNAGDIVIAKVDKAMMDDILGPRVEIAEKMEKWQAKVWDPQKVVVISDHYTPPANPQQAEIVKFTREWSRSNNVEQYYEFLGPCHQIMIEKGHVTPHSVTVGTDSHTCSYGALGNFGTGIGSTEMLGVLMTGEIWLKVPETIEVVWKGQLKTGVMAKDISLKTIGAIGHAGATYKAVEYVGDTIKSLIMDERICIANMAVEMGAKVGLIPYDSLTKAYLEDCGMQTDYEPMMSDEDAIYCERYEFDADSLVPQVACPHEVDNVKDVTEVNAAIHQAYIGSCTGGRYYDLWVAAKILKGKKVNKDVRLLVSPASKLVYEKALSTGVIEILSKAGAIILAPSCGACLGLHSGALGEGEVAISTTNRNFMGRMGSKKSEVYLASPATVAASAILGKIVDPRPFIEGGLA